jgi:hypothetical protein
LKETVRENTRRKMGDSSRVRPLLQEGDNMAYRSMRLRPMLRTRNRRFRPFKAGLLSLCIVAGLLCVVAGDYYATLGVSRNADMDDIKRAHRDLVKKHHPDKSKSPQASKKFVEVQRAYEVLSDPEKRKVYDQFGKDPDDPEVQQQQEMMRNDGRQRFRNYDPMDSFFRA